MANASESQFPGQQSDEIVLYEVRPHHYALIAKVTGIFLLAFVVAFLSLLIGNFINPLAAVIGVILAIAIAVLGFWATLSQFNQARTYITDRRVVRFDANTPFNVNSRSLSWDDVLKIKTFPPSFIGSLFNIGEVVLHARSSIISFTPNDAIEKEIAGDDLEIKYVYYYKDLGHYLDKILYTYRHSPQEVRTMRTFVTRPKGKRY